MNILAFDTCFDACSVAVQHRESGLISAERHVMRRGHGEALLPMIARTMTAAGLGFGDLDRIAVTRGPGTFTGSRVGMSAALGLAFAHQLPVVTYSSLQCVGRAVVRALGEHVAAYEGVLIARDAKRGTLLVEGIDKAGNELLPPALLRVSETLALSSQRCWFTIGSGTPMLEQERSAAKGGLTTDWPKPEPPDAALCEPDARYLLADAAKRLPDPSPVPLYLRPPDAKASSRPPLQRLPELGPVNG